MLQNFDIDSVGTELAARQNLQLNGQARSETMGGLQPYKYSNTQPMRTVGYIVVD